MASRDELIRVSLTKGQVDPTLDSLLGVLGKKNPSITLNASVTGKDASITGRKVDRNELGFDDTQFQAGIQNAFVKANAAISEFNRTSVIKIRVDTSEIDSAISKIRSLNNQSIRSSAFSSTSTLNTVARGSKPSFVREGELINRSAASSVSARSKRQGSIFSKILADELEDFRAQSATAVTETVKSFRSQGRRVTNKQGRDLSGTFEQIIQDSLDNAFAQTSNAKTIREFSNQPNGPFGDRRVIKQASRSGTGFTSSFLKAFNDNGPKSFVANPELAEEFKIDLERERFVLDRQRQQQKQQQVEQQKSSRQSQRSAVDSLRFKKISDEFFENASLGDAVSQLLGGNKARFESTKKRAELLETQKGIPGLANKLLSGLSPDTLEDRSKLFSLSRFKDPAALAQVAFGGVFGGLPGLLTAGAGAAIGGAPGALLAGTLQQAASGLIEPVLAGIKAHEDEFKAAGEAYSKSILGISSVLQANSRFSGQSASSVSVAGQLRLREQEATSIQLAARSKLLPIGIGGQTEASAVQGVVSALASRGISGRSDQIATVAERVIGAIAAQRPQLLDNEGLLLRDLQDYLGGGPQAKRTVISQLSGLRQAGSKLENAGNIEDVIKALKPAAPFAQAVRESDNIASILQKQQGAAEGLNTIGGVELFDKLKPALKSFVQVLDDKDVKAAVVDLGKNLGSLSAVSLKLTTDFIRFAATLNKPLPFLGGARIGEIETDFDYAKRIRGSNDALAQENEDRRKLGPSVQNTSSIIDSIFRSVGSEGAAAGEISPQAKFAAARQAEQLLTIPGRSLDDDEFSKYSNAAFSEQTKALTDIGQQRAEALSRFGVNNSAVTESNSQINKQKASVLGKNSQAASAVLFGELTRFSQLSSSGGQADLSQQAKILEAKNSLLTRQIDDAQKQVDSLGSLQRFRVVQTSAGRVRVRSFDDDKNEANFQTARQSLLSLQKQQLEVQDSIAENKQNQADTKAFREARILPKSLADAQGKSLSANREVFAAKADEIDNLNTQLSSLDSTINELPSKFNLQTKSGGAAFAKQVQEALTKQTQSQSEKTRLIDEASTAISARIKVSQRDVTSSDPLRRKVASDQLNEDQLLQKAIGFLRQKNENSISQRSNSLDAIQNKLLDARLAPITNELHTLDRGTVNGQIRGAQLEFDFENEKLFDFRGRREKARASLEKSPTSVAAKQQFEAAEQAVKEQQLITNQAFNKISNGEDKLPRAFNDLALAGIKLKETLQSEITQRTTLNDELQISTASLREFGSAARSKTANKELEIFSKAQNAKAQGIPIPGELDVDEETFKAIQRNAVAADFASSLASIGRSDLANGVGAQRSITSLIPSSGGSFQSQLDAEGDRLAAAVGKTALELEKLPIAISNAVLAIKGEQKEASKLLGTDAAPSPLPFGPTGRLTVVPLTSEDSPLARQIQNRETTPFRISDSQILPNPKYTAGASLYSAANDIEKKFNVPKGLSTETVKKVQEDVSAQSSGTTAASVDGLNKVEAAVNAQTAAVNKLSSTTLKVELSGNSSQVLREGVGPAFEQALQK